MFRTNIPRVATKIVREYLGANKKSELLSIEKKRFVFIFWSGVQLQAYPRWRAGFVRIPTEGS